MEYYPAFKRKEILTCGAIWMNLEDTMLSEIAQAQRTDIVWFLLCEGPRIVKTIQTESRIVAVDLGEGRLGR